MDEISTPPTFTLPRWKITPGMLFLFVLLFALFAIVGLTLLRRNAGPVTQGPAPAFTIETYEGGEFTLADYRGQFVVVNFWGSWCIGCRDEMPELQASWEKYRDDGVVIVGVGFRDVESAARKFLAEYNVTYPTGNDTGLRITAAYGITGAPETYIVGPDGTVVEFYIGQFPNGWLDTTIARLLAGDAS